MEFTTRKFLDFLGRAFCLGLCVLFWSLPALSQAAAAPLVAKAPLPDQSPSAFAHQASAQQDAKISGKVVDQTGVEVVGATVTLTRDDQSSGISIVTDEEGQFYFFNVPPGPFHLTVSSPGLASQDFSATLQPAESLVTPLLMLVVATQVTQVEVTLTPEELATAEIKDQEKQRVFGVIPNFYVSYVPDAAPLKPKHKFELAWKSSTDPFTFGAVGLVAGINQAAGRWSGYGQGAQGFAKRYGASYADVFTGTYIGGAVLPSLLKQDPRYFYRGKGSKASRFFYALASSVICKGDNGRWQPNYSSVMGNLAAGGIANLYYPSKDRHGAGLVFSTAFIRMGEMAVANIFQEFLVPKLTPNLPTRAASHQ
jgi:hypothetical protein